VAEQRAQPAHARPSDSLIRNASSLVATTGVTAVLGLLFWTLSARHYPDADVGRATTTIAAATVLGGLSGDYLSAIMIRFLATAGDRTRVVVARAYAVGALTGLVVATLFVLAGLGSVYIPDTTTQKLFFIGMVVLFVVFALQDAVLTGLGRAPAVLVENIAFSVAKVVLVILGVSMLSVSAIVLAWVIPAFLAVIGVTAYLVFVVLRKGSDVLEGESTFPQRTEVVSYASAEYVRRLLSSAVSFVLPLLVAHQLGLEQAAYFSVPWLILSVVSIMLSNVSSALVVESERSEQHTTVLLRKAILLGLGAILLATVLLLLLAPVALGILGQSYVDHSTGLVRWFAVSLPFSAPVVLYGTLLWLDRRLWLLALVQGGASALTIIGSVFLLRTLGLDGIGVSYLMGEVVVALVCFPFLVRRLRALGAEEGVSMSMNPRNLTWGGS
jgi:O-antigen/teichoic acid export membrane protein